LKGLSRIFCLFCWLSTVFQLYRRSVS